MIALASIRLRLSLVVTGAVVAVGAVVGLGSYVWLQESLESELCSFAVHEAEETAIVITPLHTVEEVRKHPELLDEIFGEGVVGVAVWTAEGVPVLRSPPDPRLDPWPEGLRGARTGRPAFRWLTPTSDGRPGALQTAILVRGNRDRAWIVSTAVSVDRAQAALTRYRWAAPLVVLLATALAFGGSLLLLTIGLRPVHALVGEARALLEATRPGGRLTRPGSGAELVELVDLLNAMLERTEESLGLLRRFAAHAGHELRTPLARIRSEAESALLEAPDGTAADTLASVLEEVEELRGTLDALLELSHGHGADLAAGGEPLDLAALAAEVLDGAEPLAEEQGARLVNELVGPLPVRGQRVLLARVLWNLLGNALKFARGGAVTVAAADRDGQAVLEVADEGPGWGVAEPEALFEPFATGGRPESGRGLGLALARAIARRHGGELSVVPAERGARLRLTLPLADPAQASPSAPATARGSVTGAAQA